MPRVRIPTSDRERIIQMERLLKAVAVHDTAGTTPTGAPLPTLSKGVVNALTALAPQLADEVRQIEQWEGKRHRASVAATDATAQLVLLVRQAIDMLHWQVRTGVTTAAVFRVYGLPLTGAMPASKRRQLWIDLAATLCSRAAQVEDPTIPPLVNQTALEAALAAAEATISEVEEAKYSLYQLRRQCSQTRRTVDKRLTQVRAELNYQLRDEPHVVRRQVMREFGIRFTHAPEEEAVLSVVEA